LLLGSARKSCTRYDSKLNKEKKMRGPPSVMYWKQLSHFYRLEPFSFQISRNISTDRQSRDGIFTATQAFNFLFHRFILCVWSKLLNTKWDVCWSWWNPAVALYEMKTRSSKEVGWFHFDETEEEGRARVKWQSRGDVGQRGSRVQSRSILYNIACVYICNTVGRIGSTWITLD
jgi:hypothetical protein